MPSKAPSGKAALEKKRKERADLKDGDIVWIAIRATESNLQRLGAFLIFADYHIEEAPRPVTLLPWEDPNDPRFEQPPELQINHELVKKDIYAAMEALVTRDGEIPAKARIREIIQQHGAEKFRDVPDNRLLELLAALKGEMA